MNKVSQRIALLGVISSGRRHGQTGHARDGDADRHHRETLGERAVSQRIAWIR